MLKSYRGKIINISSVWGICGASCETAYSASKGGVNAFTKALAKELAPSNIYVNAIACGAIDTDMNKGLEKQALDILKSEIPASPLTLALLEASAPLLFESIAADAAITIAPTPHLRKKSLRRIKQPP